MRPTILQLTMPMFPGYTGDPIHPTLLLDANHAILVDCGGVGSLPLLEQVLKGSGLCTQDLTDLVLTHHDHDHMGCAAALKRANRDLRVSCSNMEAPYISGMEKPLRLCQAEALQASLPPEQKAFGQAFCEMLRTIEPVDVDSFLEDGQYLPWDGGCRVLATPGHTPGHISLHCEEERVIITADAFALEAGKPVIANPQFTLNLEEARVSMEKLMSLKNQTYFCYHGGMYTKPA